MKTHVQQEHHANSAVMYLHPDVSTKCFMYKAHCVCTVMLHISLFVPPRLIAVYARVRTDLKPLLLTSLSWNLLNKQFRFSQSKKVMGSRWML